MPSRFNRIRSQERPKLSYFQISINKPVTRGNMWDWLGAETLWNESVLR